MDKNQYRGAIQKSDAELEECIDNREKYLPETVEEALAELQSRGMEFSDEELKVIAEDMQARRELAASGPDNFMMFTDGKYTQVEDPRAPLFFSKRTILVFSVLTSVFFGAIMLAVNINKTPKRNNAILVVLFGLAYTIVTRLAIGYFNSNIAFLVIFGWLGAYIMNTLFWDPYIGKNTLYRVRPIWVPLIIVIVLTGLVVASFIYSGQSIQTFFKL